MRINDKIAELELQVGAPAGRRRRRRRKYLVLRDELRTLEISVWLENLDKIKTDSIKLNTDYALAQAGAGARERRAGRAVRRL